jgi:hypothetical protein
MFASELLLPAMKSNIIIKDTHRALWYEDGVMTRVLGPGRYRPI